NLEPDVVYAEPNYISRVEGVPNDQFYKHQWHYPYINLPAAWDITTGNANTVIAVIDTGAKYAHPDLGARLITGDCYDFITDPQISLDGGGPDPNAEDVGDDPDKLKSTFHGSHVAGTIGASSNNDIGLAGVNWSSGLMILRALGAGGGTDYDISQAILYAAGLPNATLKSPSKRANVINMSLSSDGDSATERDAISKALGAGVCIVAAAGNQNSSAPRYPAAYPGVIAVGSIDLSGARAPYSNYGSHISVVAPGGNSATDSNDDGYVDGVLSIGWNEDTDKPAYVFKQGTSMAAPHVAGVVSLLLGKKPGMPPAEIKQVLEKTALDIGDPGKDDEYGYGLVDPVKALKEVTSVSSQPKLIVSTLSLDFGSTETEMTVTISNGGGGDLGKPTVTITGASWLKAQFSAGSNSVLIVRVERTGLATGQYTGKVKLASNGGSAEITVVMKVGTPGASGLPGEILVLALDPRTLEGVGTIDSSPGAEQVTDKNQDGILEFQFPPIFAGFYFVAAGNDPNGNRIICEANEYCGFYPVLSQWSEVRIQPIENTGGVDFVLEKPTTAASASLLEELRLKTGQSGFAIGRETLSAIELQRVFRQKLHEAGR
ncbi:MAG: hypothetical protein EHM61_23175, partial [Acidobacteria bacterium]